MVLLARWAQEEPDRIAAHFPDTERRLSFGELDRRANRLAQWLIGLGLEAGDGISLLMENGPELIEFAHAARRAGLYYTPLSTHLRIAEVAYLLADSGAKLLVATPAMAELAEAIAADGDLAGMPRFATGAGLPGWGSVEAAIAAFPGEAVLPTRPVGREMLYSSGTTGMPKGVRRDLLPAEARGKPDWTPTWLATYGLGRDTVYLSPAPMYHAAPHRYIMRCIDLGGTAVIMAKFDAERALALIERYRVTHSQWVPTMFVRMLALPEAVRRRHDLSSHRVAIHAAAPCPRPVKQAMIDWWGPILWEYYAGSESIGGTVIDSRDWMRRPGSVGRPIDSRVHILDDEGHELPPGEVGGIWFSGGGRFRYHNAPEKTAAAYDREGRATYGDLGHVDEEGFLYLSDRRADLVISGGVNIYPWEIEQVLAKHPAVGDVAVIGVAHPDFGESVHAVIRLADEGATPPGRALEEELTAFCRRHLAGPKCPRSYDFVDGLPRGETGKLLRRVLKDKYRAQHASQPAQ